MTWFRGGHSWPPRALCEEGVDWLELRAMLGGRRARDTAFIAQALARDLQRADSLERAGQWDAAETRYRELALDVPDRTEGRSAREHADDLAGRGALRALRERARSLTADDARDEQRQFAAIRQARTSASPLAPEELLDQLGVASLRKRLASTDSLERDSAAQRLSNVAAWIAFYEPRSFLAAGQPRRAATSLRAAALLNPLRGESCELARRAAQLLPHDEAERMPPCT
jgi:hypothetical protein